MVTSLLQALMAVLVFMFVHSFLPLLYVGLGFAGGRLRSVCGPIAGVAVRLWDGASVVVGVPVLWESWGRS